MSQQSNEGTPGTPVTVPPYGEWTADQLRQALADRDDELNQLYPGRQSPEPTVELQGQTTEQTGMPADARAALDAFRAKSAARRAERGELPLSERPSSDRGATARYVRGRGMPFHAP